MMASSSQSPHESPFLSYLNSLSPIRQPVKTYQNSFPSYCILDELDSPTLVYTTPSIGFLGPTQLFGSGIIGGESLIEDPCGSLLSEEPKMVHQEMPAYADEPGKTQYVEWPSQECRKLDSNLSAAVVLDKQHCHDSIAQRAVNELQDHQDCTPQLMPEPLQDVKECEDCGEMGPALHVSAENMSRDGSEATEKHCVVKRCLQFEEATSNALGSNNSLLPAHSPEDSISSAISSVSKDLKASYMALNATSSKKKMVKLSEDSKPITYLLPPQFRGNFPLTSSKASDIGFYLNSNINAMPCGCAATTGMRLAEDLDSMKRCLISSNVDGKASFGTVNERHEIDASVAADFVTSSSLIEPITSLYPASFHDNRKLSPTDARNSEEFKPYRPSKKKKRTPNTTDDCKRCTCKKSECMKLYCECFASEFYCDEFCSCQGCLNKPEYEDTVHDIKQKIESRNPSAFAPKVVQNATDIPSNNMEDVNLKTPSSTRHKRGCNCKRSKCLKNYCDCYQANVGCTSGCGCQGCENSYGKKEDYVAMKDDLSKERESSKVEELLGLLHARLHDNDVHRLSPLTPWLQCSDMGQSSLTKVNQLTPLSNPPSMFGASWDWTHSSPMAITPMTMKSGRGFILKTVPSFPPLTPYIDDSKGKGHSDKKDSGDTVSE